MGAGPLQYRSTQRCVGTGIRCYLCFYSHDFPVFITSHGEIHDKMMSFWMYKQGFRSGQPHFTRASGEIGDQSRIRQYCHILFSAKTASYETILYFYFIGPEDETAFMEGTICRLIGGNDHHISIFIHITEHRLRLKKCMFRPRCFKMS